MTRLRIRSIKPEFYADEKIRKLSIAARYLVIGLITRADDRGRQMLLEHQIIGHVFPGGDVSERRMKPWLKEILDAGIVRAYEVGGDHYLWFPRFWRHQRINRPSESSLPAHPSDSYARLPFDEAYAQFSEDSCTSPCPDTPRASARSSPIPSRSKEGSKDKVDTRARAVDQGVPPSGFPDKLRDILDQALATLIALQLERGGAVPTMRGTGLNIMRRPDRDYLGVAGELEHWALAGRGANIHVKDWPRTYGSFLDRAPAGAPTRPANIDNSARGLVERLNRDGA